jgi:hypothetical protein
LLHESVPVGTLEVAAIAAMIAGVTAFASTAFLMHYFRRQTPGRLIHLLTTALSSAAA